MASQFKRVILIVLDSAGVGELPDAHEYGDVGSNTIANTAGSAGGLNIPALESLGMGNIIPVKGVKPVAFPKAYFGKMAELSKGKDTTVGHWEMMGIITYDPFPVFPSGFPKPLLDQIGRKAGVEFIGNCPASGTAIINDLGQEHMNTGKLIVYTSADSVFQIAAHEGIVPLDMLYRVCGIAREVLNPLRVCRVIARPFQGEPGNFFRTGGRKDYSIPPPDKSLLEILIENNHSVFGIGKVGEIFAGRGFKEVIHTAGNKESMDAVVRFIKKVEEGLIFANLVDFDMLYGHRNNPSGYAAALEEFDDWLAGVLRMLGKDDLMFITADHGNDPTTPSTDHSREYVPILAFNPAFRSCCSIGVRSTFSDLGQTIGEIFLRKVALKTGNSFLSLFCR